MLYANGECLDQSVHPCCLIKTLFVHRYVLEYSVTYQYILQYLMTLSAGTEGPDQIVQMLMQI